MDNYSSSGKSEFRELVQYMNANGIGLEGYVGSEFE